MTTFINHKFSLVALEAQIRLFDFFPVLADININVTRLFSDFYLFHIRHIYR